MSSDFLSRVLNTQPDPDMERVLVALGCDGDSLHDLLVAAEAMRARVRELSEDLALEEKENDDLYKALVAMRAKWEADLVRLGGLPEKPLGVEVGGCTCQRFDSETKKHTYGHAPCRYHEAATRQPWNHRIAWNCPTYWDGCNCEGGPYFYTADAEHAVSTAWREARRER